MPWARWRDCFGTPCGTAGVRDGVETFPLKPAHNKKKTNPKLRGTQTSLKGTQTVFALVSNSGRVQVAEHTLRRHRVHPPTQDDLAFPATLPSSDD